MINYGDILLDFAFAFSISAICFIISFILKRRLKEKGELSPKEQEWMSVMKFAGFLFLVLPLVLFLLALLEKVIGYFVALFIGLIVILPSLLKKGKF